MASPSLAPADSLGNTAFASVLVIDASKSMRGDAIDGAMAAARAFAGRRKLEQRLGVILFNKRAVTALPLTADQARDRRRPVVGPAAGERDGHPRSRARRRRHAARGADRGRLGRAALRRRGHVEGRRPAGRRGGGPPSRGARLHRRAQVRRVPARDVGGAGVRHRRRLRAGLVAAVARPASSSGSARRSAASTCSATAPSPARTSAWRSRSACAARSRRRRRYTSPAARTRAVPGLQALGLGRAVALAGGRRPRGHAGRTAHRRDRAHAAPRAGATGCSSG